MTLKKKCATKSLPPVFPLVLYNGNQKWNASTNIQDLILDSKIDNLYIPNFSYYLIAENEYSTEDLMKIENAVSAVFMLENATAKDLKNSFTKIVNLIRKEPQDVIINLERWFLNFVGKDIGSQDKIKEEFSEIKEVTSMLATTIEEIRMDGVNQGISQGISQGINQAKVEDVKRAIQQGLDDSLINAITEVSFEKIEELRKIHEK